MEYQSWNKRWTIDKQKTMEAIIGIQKFEIFMTFVKRPTKLCTLTNFGGN